MAPKRAKKLAGAALASHNAKLAKVGAAAAAAAAAPPVKGSAASKAAAKAAFAKLKSGINRQSHVYLAAKAAKQLAAPKPAKKRGKRGPSKKARDRHAQVVADSFANTKKGDWYWRHAMAANVAAEKLGGYHAVAAAKRKSRQVNFWEAVGSMKTQHKGHKTDPACTAAAERLNYWRWHPKKVAYVE